MTNLMQKPLVKTHVTSPYAPEPEYFINLKVLLKTFFCLFLIHGTDSLLTKKLIEYLGLAQEKESPLLAILFVFSILITILTTFLKFAAFFTFIYQTSGNKKIPWNRFDDLMREGLVYTGKIFLFSLLLIVPGVFVLIRYSLLPFVVFFDSSYQSHQVKALNQAYHYSLGCFPQLVLLSLSSFVLIPFLAKGLEPLLSSFAPTLAGITLVFFTAFCEGLVLLLYFSLFAKQKLKLKMILA